MWVRQSGYDFMRIKLCAREQVDSARTLARQDSVIYDQGVPVEVRADRQQVRFHVAVMPGVGNVLFLLRGDE